MNIPINRSQEFTFNRSTRERIFNVIKALLSSDVGFKVKWMSLVLIMLLVGINALNIVNSYVGRDFMTAIANRNTSEFVWQSFIYLAVFAASTSVAVFYRFFEESLALLARKWLTQRFVNSYLEHPTYYRLNDQIDENGEIANIDQRISDDVRAFTVTILSFTLMILNGTFTVLAFSGVMWSISPALFIVAVLYALGGSYLTIKFGYALVGLNYQQLDKEAAFRSDLLHLRENAESVALLRHENRLKTRILRHLSDLANNFQKMIFVNRNLGFFTTGYNYLIQIIPALIVAPMYMNGYVEFGVITQAAMAFAHLLGAFSLIVTQFQSISSFAAEVTRLGSLADAIDTAQSPRVSKITTTEDESGNRVTYQNLSLWLPHNGQQVLVRDLSVSISHGTRVLILGADDTAKLALFRATAGIWDGGEGQMIRPGFNDLLFLPERPYLPPGTLRESLVHTGQEEVIPDERIQLVLRALDVEAIIERADGLDTEQHWDNILSLSEQKLLAFARIVISAPRFAFLDRLNTALSVEDVARMLRLLTEHHITYVNVGHSRHGRRDTDDKLEDYDAILEIAGDGSWSWKYINQR
jgi:putative ATP-binding cassette transporter